MSRSSNSHFNSFLKLISRSFVIAKYIDIFDDETPRNAIVYNGSESEEAFYKDLGYSLNSFTTELEKNSSDYFKKSEYLHYLKGHKRMLVDVRDQFFIVGKDDKIIHKKFLVETKNSVLEIPEENQVISYYSEYIQHQYNFIKKAILFIEDLIETIIKLDSRDISFKIPESIQPNQASTDKPFAFFEFLILKRGLDKLKEDFIPSEEEEYYGGYTMDYNVDEEKITYNEHDEDGQTTESVVFFKDVLYKKLTKEFYECMAAIDEKTGTLVRNREEVINYLNIQLPRLKLAIDDIATYQYAQKFEFISKALNALTKKIFKQYKSFISETLQIEFSEIIPVGESVDRKFSFSGDSKEFVKIFGTLIKDQKLSIPGIKDKQPTFDLLAGHFEIKKARGKGLVKKDSLSTEFRTFMAESATDE